MALHRQSEVEGELANRSFVDIGRVFQDQKRGFFFPEFSQVRNEERGGGDHDSFGSEAFLIKPFHLIRSELIA